MLMGPGMSSMSVKDWKLVNFGEIPLERRTRAVLVGARDTEACKAHPSRYARGVWAAPSLVCVGLMRLGLF